MLPLLSEIHLRQKHVALCAWKVIVTVWFVGFCGFNGGLHNYCGLFVAVHNLLVCYGHHLLKAFLI